MKRTLMTLVGMTLLGLPAAARASDAESSVRIGSDQRGTATADAAARYDGEIGFARTQTRSGNITLARGVAVGFDQEGLSLSLSNGVATRSGLAVATNFNLSIGSDGRVSGSSGNVVSAGTAYRAAETGGSTSTRRAAPAISFAAGRSDPAGQVRADTRAWTRPSIRYSAPLRIYRR
ncbi:MAG TPA: hypothetical protein VGM03_11525 [Phycisphaerae bacterium]|jgi:hypothetical protein